MGRSKRGSALFDLLANSEDKGGAAAKVPDWWSRGDKPDAATADVPASPTAKSRPTSVPRPTALDASSGGSTRFVELDGERIRVSLTSFSAALLVFAGLIVAFGVFELGRWHGERVGFTHGHAAGRESYAADVTDEIEAARNQPPAAHLLNGLLGESQKSAVAEPGTTEPGATSTGPQWIRDYTYIVAQEFSAGNDDAARQAQEFLAVNGVATELVRLLNGGVQLITTQGYNRRNPTQRRMADQLLEKTHALGTQYYATGAGYKLEGYFKTLKSEAW